MGNYACVERVVESLDKVEALCCLYNLNTVDLGFQNCDSKLSRKYTSHDYPVHINTFHIYTT